MKQNLDSGQNKVPDHRARLIATAVEAGFLLHGVVRRLVAIDPDEEGRGLEDIVAGWLCLGAGFSKIARNAGISDDITVVSHELALSVEGVTGTDRAKVQKNRS